MRGQSFAGAIAITVSLAATASCSLLVSTDGLTGASADAGMSTDADGGGTEASSAADASVVDANADGAAFSCKTLTPPPMFCDDFERDSVLGIWSDLSLGGGGAIVIDPQASVSATRSLLCTTPAGSDAGTLGASMHHVTFPILVSDIQFSFDENLAAAVDDNQFDLLRLVLHMPGDPASGSLQIAVTFDAATTYLDENDYRVTPTKYIAHNYGRKPIVAQWEHFALHLTLGARPHVSVVLGGDTVVDADLASPNITSASVEVILGLYHSFVPGAARALHLDNVLLDAH